MKVKIYLVNYNERKIIRQTILHYRKYIPLSEIVICDNHSTDDSVTIAESMGCKIIKWGDPYRLDDVVMANMKNNIWKTDDSDWIIIADMDEWLCATQEDLQKEMKQGTSILKTAGFNIIGESKTEDLSDIPDLDKISIGIYCHTESKQLCFNKRLVYEMNFTPGAHFSRPKGTIKYSDKFYLIKHMDTLGLRYKLKKQHERRERAKHQWRINMSTHYKFDDDLVIEIYNNSLSKSRNLKPEFPNDF